MTDPARDPDTVPTAVGQVALLVRDIDATVAFYRDTLALAHFGTWGDLAFFHAGSTRLFCSKVDEANWTPLSTVYLSVADLDGTVARLEQAGVAMTFPPGLVHTHDDGTEEWMAFLTDPAGNTLGLMTTRSGTAASKS
ncbi:VOC family protein [Lentzea sp.]|uniref:VOC family protein n=1 Tax=Lentzea sp. TaxID=56099 RepID=UPI002BB9977B|nr:VOC family protein [Lentzea sp.]HUQ60550.1 VOC family protein [Lentzea sp.]